MNPSQRIQAVQSPIIAVVAELIRAHPGTISLGQGVVHYPPPEQALERLRQALDDPRCHLYGHVVGFPPLLEKIREKLEQEQGVQVGDRRDIIVTAGGNMAFQQAILALADPGDEVILQTPYYFNHEMAVRIASAVPVCVPTDAEYQPQIEVIRQAITPRTRAVVTISPNNPTGVVYDEEMLRAVNALCQEHGLYHIHDEAYEYFTYEGTRHFSPAAIDGAEGHTLTLYSLSKAYGFAGWRIGYLVVPRTLRDAVKKIQDTNLICPPIASQHAALGAMEAGPAYCHQYLGPMADVRRLVLDELHRLGDYIVVPPATGAFYFFVRVRTEMDAMTLVRRLIAEHGVAVIPGMTFGMEDGCYLRIAYGALQKDTVAEAMTRFARGMGSL